MKVIDRAELLRRLTEITFGKPLISNIYRGLVAEVLVASALSEQWRHCSEDWSGWDFIHEDGCKLEVKQSASLQSSSSGRISACRFGIAESQGTWAGDQWTADRSRKAALYVFAHHDNCDPREADHRDPLQWKFYILPSAQLPPQKTISLANVISLTESYSEAFTTSCSMPFDVMTLGGGVDTIRSLIEGDEATQRVKATTLSVDTPPSP